MMAGSALRLRPRHQRQDHEVEQYRPADQHAHDACIAPGWNIRRGRVGFVTRDGAHLETAIAHGALPIASRNPAARAASAAAVSAAAKLATMMEMMITSSRRTRGSFIAMIVTVTTIAIMV